MIAEENDSNVKKATPVVYSYSFLCVCIYMCLCWCALQLTHPNIISATVLLYLPPPPLLPLLLLNWLSSEDSSNGTSFLPAALPHGQFRRCGEGTKEMEVAAVMGHFPFMKAISSGGSLLLQSCSHDLWHCHWKRER